MMKGFSQDELAFRLYDTLNDMGIPSHLTGWDCIYAAVPYICDRKPIGEVYRYVGMQLDMTAESVERDIRTAAAASMDRLTPNGIVAIYGNTIDPEKGKPTNAQLLFTAARRVYGMGEPAPLRAGKKSS